MKHIVSILEALILIVAKNSVQTCSRYGMYQPEQPEELKILLK